MKIHFERNAAATMLIVMGVACIIVGVLLTKWTLQYPWSDYSFAVQNGLGNGWAIGAVVAVLPLCVGVPVALYGVGTIIKVVYRIAIQR